MTLIMAILLTLWAIFWITIPMLFGPLSLTFFIVFISIDIINGFMVGKVWAEYTINRKYGQ